MKNTINLQKIIPIAFVLFLAVTAIVSVIKFATAPMSLLQVNNTYELYRIAKESASQQCKKDTISSTCDSLAVTNIDYLTDTDSDTSFFFYFSDTVPVTESSIVFKVGIYDSQDKAFLVQKMTPEKYPKTRKIE